MLEPDAFDPTHALDGWRPPAPAPLQELDLAALLRPGPKHAQPLLAHAGTSGFDPTHLLDGWRPPAPGPLDLELKSLQRAGSGPDEATLARLKARGYEMLDVEDIELVEAPPRRRVLVEASVLAVPSTLPLAEAQPVQPPSDENAAPAESAVDVPLPDDEVWPLFMEEAQILEPHAAPAAEAAAAQTPTARPAAAGELNVDEAAPAFESPGLEVPAPEPEVERALVDAPAVEVAAAEPELAAADEDQVVENAVAPEIEVASTAMVATLPEPEPEPMSSVIAEAPEARVAAELAEAEAVGEPVPEPLPFHEEARPLAEAAAAEPEVAEPPIEPPAPASPPMPSFIDEIQLPCAPPAPAEFEAPALDFRVAPPPPEPDPESVIAGIELPRVAPQPVVVELPELDIAALAPRPPQPDPRLLAQWQAGAWTALARQVAGASEELLQTPGGLRVESHAPQWLCAVWPPQAENAPLGRWPELASLVDAETRGDALQQWLGELPDEAPLWSADLEADWDLVAELVLHQDTGLRPSQARALRELAEVERKVRLTRLSEGYALQGRVARRRA